MSGQAIVDGGARELRRVALLLTATAALVLAGAGIALACTGRAQLYEIKPSSGKAGQEASVPGSRWDEGGPGDDAEVEIRWDGRNGELLTTAQGPSFNADFTIPEDAEAGPHIVVATAYNKATGQVEGEDSSSFRVLANESPENSSNPENNPNPDNSSDPDSSSSPENSSDPENSSSPEGSSDPDDSGSQNTTSSSSMSASGSRGSGSEGMTSDGSSSSSPSEGSTSSSSPSQGSTSSTSPSQGSTAASSPSQESTPSESGAAQPDESPQQAGAPDEARSREPAGQDQPRQSVGQQPTRSADEQPAQSVNPNPQPMQSTNPEPAEPQPVASPDSSGQPEPSAGASSAEAEAEASAPDPQAAAPAEGQGDSEESRAGRPDTDASRDGSHPSARSGSGDLWSGFDTGDETLSPGLDQPATGNQDGGMSQQLALAVGLFGAGALALMGGGFATLRRRRALVATAASRRDV